MRSAVAVTAAVAALALMPAFLAAQEQPAPAPMTMETAPATLVVGDISGFADALQSFLSTVPGSEGMNLDDMKEFGPGAGAVLVATGAGKNVLMAMEATGDHAARMIPELQANGMQARTDEGFVLAATDATLLDSQAGLVAEMRAALAAPNPTPTAVVTVRMANLVRQYDPMIQMFMKTIPAMAAASQSQMAAQQGQTPDQEAMLAMSQMLEGELRVIYSVAKQVDTVRVELAPRADVLVMEKTVTAVEGTNLARLFAAPCGKAPLALLGALPGKGAIRGAMAVNNPAMVEFIDAEAKTITSEMGLSGESLNAYIEWMKESLQFYGDGFALDMMEPDQPIMSGGMILNSEDPQSAFGFYENMQARMKETGVEDFYANLGTPMSIEWTPNASTHGGVAIHKFTMDQDNAALPPEAQEAMEKMIGEMTFNIALLDKGIVYSFGQEPIGPMIDAMKGGASAPAAPLEAQRLFGPDMEGLVDFNLGAFMPALALGPGSQIPPGVPNPFTALGAGLEGAGPVSLGFTSEDGKAIGKVAVPSSLVAGFAKGIAAMQQPPPTTTP